MSLKTVWSKVSSRQVIPIMGFCMLVWILALGLFKDPRLVPSPLVNSALPSIILERLDNRDNIVSSEDLIGEPFLLNVWASWCRACEEEHPLLISLQKTENVKIIGLNYKDSRSDSSNWLKKHGNPYKFSLFDPNGVAGFEFGVYGVPETFVVNSQGTITYKHIGPLTHDIFFQAIKPLLK